MRGNGIAIGGIIGSDGDGSETGNGDEMDRF